jgi:hypothetical protein
MVAAGAEVDTVLLLVGALGALEVAVLVVAGLALQEQMVLLGLQILAVLVAVVLAMGA